MEWTACNAQELMQIHKDIATVNQGKDNIDLNQGDRNGDGAEFSIFMQIRPTELGEIRKCCQGQQAMAQARGLSSDARR